MIRCLIADDSPTFRRVLRELLSREPGIEVVGEAADGASAVEQAIALRPDVVTMDVEMPGQDGFAAIDQIMRRAPVPILVIGAGADDEGLGISYRAVQLGAVEVLPKPSARDPARYEAQSRAIRQAVRAVAGVKVVTRPSDGARRYPSTLGGEKVACIGIAASTGGPAALRSILSALPRDFSAPILVVQHILDGFCEGFARWLGGELALEVKLAEDGERPRPGTVYLAPSDRHLLVSLGRLRLDDGEPLRGSRPSASLLFASLAREYGRSAAGLVLTGMGDDGASGLEALRKAGGFTAAQGPESATVYGMPRAALETGAATFSLELGEIPALLTRLTAGLPAPIPGARKRLLLVDDSRSILQVEQAALAEHYELYTALDGRQALTEIERIRPHAVLLDLHLPVLNGDQALFRLRESPRHRGLPVILVTGEKDPVVRRRCWELGCSAILDKPIDARRLLEAVQRCVPC